MQCIHINRKDFVRHLLIFVFIPIKAEVKGEEEKPKELIVACSSDRGLCGAIHSSICKHIKAELAADASNAAILCIGDKSRAQLARFVQGYCITLIIWE